MTSSHPTGQDRITIAILALGGQGGGVLADWILDLASANGYIAQGTSVPGVAQRTGSTVYYIEMVRAAAAGANHPVPVLALMPVPGDVDVVLASELMETGRAILRGFVSSDRTTLVGSTHRIYAISEKTALGDGTAAGDRILDAAERRSARFIGFDMDRVATEAGSVISSVMFGALAGSNALPFPSDAFEEAIRRGGKAIPANLNGFRVGRAHAERRSDEIASASLPPAPTTPAGRALAARIEQELPPAACPLALEGLRRLMDYQDASYAALYLDRLRQFAILDNGREDWRLTRSAARHLALWMSYEDIVRVADLKVRSTRTARVVDEMNLGDEQLMAVTEYMHPRLQEVADALPRRLGAWLLRTRWRPQFELLFRKGRHIETTSVHWFVALRVLAAMRAIRRSTLRFAEEQQRIEAWLGLAARAATVNLSAAAEILETQTLIKGYSDTFERGLTNFNAVMAALDPLLHEPDAHVRISRLREAALADEKGDALRRSIACGGAVAA